jgi:uncharacterized protein
MLQWRCRAGRPKRSITMPRNQLGIFVRSPAAGRVKTRLSPPLTPGQARRLYLSFLQDITGKIRRSKWAPVVFLDGDRTPEIDATFPSAWRIEPQAGKTLGDRLTAAFGRLLATPGDRAVVIGSDSPDLPIRTVKRAFQKLRHCDVVLGPATDGGYTLIGLRAPAPALFDGISWGEPTVFDETVRAAHRAGLTLSLVPMWYDVDDAASLRLLQAMCHARTIAGGERLPHVERVLDSFSRGDE